jgi:uncharacterized membrane protein
LKSKILILVMLYLISFSVIVSYNLTHELDGVKSDTLYEYEVYKLNLSDGWQVRPESIVNSCVITTLIPSYIGINPYVAFRIVPAFFYALMPVFVYLIARKYTRYAIMAPILVMVSPHMLMMPDLGRVGVALGLFSGLVWSLLEKRAVVSLVFAALLPFAHYGTSAVALALLLVIIIVVLVVRRKVLVRYVAVFCVLLVVVVVWDFVVNSTVGERMSGAISDVNTVTSTQGSLAVKGGFGSQLFDLGSRDVYTQTAFGVGFSNLTVSGKLELFLSWIVVLIMSLGLIVGKGDAEFRAMSFALYGMILLTVLLPWLSRTYGLQRVFFTGLTLLSVSFTFGLEWVSQKTKLPVYLLGVLVIVPYAVSVGLGR